MSRYISKKDRAYVRKRANYCCEYCRTPEQFSFIGFEIDHIVSLKHGGDNDLGNLAFACAICNYRKGTDLGTFLSSKLELVRFFNPRIDKWHEHFELSGILIVAKTDIGEATNKIFQLNELRRVEERELLILAGLFK